MKKALPLLFALIAVSAWAGEAIVAPSMSRNEAMVAPPVGVVIEFKGADKSISALIAAMEKEGVYKEAACATVPGKDTGKPASISCGKAEGALMTYLSKHAPADTLWSITTASSCPTGCYMMNCPPPGGPVACCKRTSIGYRTC